MSSKNILQEYCQKKIKILPVYDTSCVSGPSHNPSFESKVSIENGLEFTGKGSSKKLAEISAARSANLYLGLEDTETSEICNVINDFDKIYIDDNMDVLFVDLENRQTDIDKILTLDNIIVFGFAHKDHPILKKNLSPMRLFTIQSEAKDAADVLMSILIAHVTDSSLMGSKHNYYILTTDHIGEAIKDVITSLYKINISWIKSMGEYYPK